MDLLLYPKLLAYANSFYEWNCKTLCRSISLPDYEVIVNQLLDKFLSGRITSFSGFKKSLRNMILDHKKKKSTREFKKIPFEDWMKHGMPPNQEDDDFNVEFLLEKIKLLDDLENSIVNNHFKDKSVVAKLIEITTKFDLNCFIGIPIEEITCLIELNKTTRQNRDFHKKKFDRNLKKLHSVIKEESLHYLSISILNNGASTNNKQQAVELRMEGQKAKERAKLFQNQFMTFDDSSPFIDENQSIIKSLFISLLNYTKASLFFNAAIEIDPDYTTARYNYGYCLKRLGYLERSIEEFNDCLKSTSVRQEKSMIHEALGGTYFLTKNYDKALAEYKKALKITPNDKEVLLNVLEINYLLTKNVKILKTLKKLVHIGQAIPEMRRKLLIDIAEKHDKEISTLCYTILQF